MKTLFTVSMIILVTIASVVSCKLFLNAHYDFSALLTMTSIVSTILLINIVSNKKINLS